MRTLRSVITTLFLAAIIGFALVVWAAHSAERGETVAKVSQIEAPPVEQPAVSTSADPQKPADSSLNDQAKEAVKNAPDVGMKVLKPGTIMVGNSFGPCGILYKRATDFLWHPDPGADQPYSDLSSAVEASYSACEAMFQEQKAARGAETAYPPTASSQPPIPAPQS